jgi:glycosyltransferase involved in cell wall biosynthesis
LRFTVVTPVFNGMPWLPDAIESVAAQRADVDLEHIVLDGGSTDGSREWLAAHADLGYMLVAEPDEGQTDAMIKGFARATGEILGWLNSDDLYEAGALAAARDVFEARPDVVIVSGGCLVIDAASAVVGSIPVPPVSTFDELIHFPTNLADGTLFRADAYRAIGGLDRSFNLAMDVDLWMRLARRGAIVTLPDRVQCRFRIHPSAKTVAGIVPATREDLRARLRRGLAPWSPAARYLIYHGYWRPFVAGVRARVGRRRQDGAHGA